MKLTLTEELFRIKSMMNLNEDVSNMTLSDFPQEIRDILFDNYLYAVWDFDWNTEQDKFINKETGKLDGEGFDKWKDEHHEEQFAKNKKKILLAVATDLHHLKMKLYYAKESRDLEEHLISLFGFHITDEAGNFIDNDVFENFVKENPKYKKAYDQWMEVSKKYDEWFMKDYNSSKGVPTYNELHKLYYYLKNGQYEAN